MSAKQILDRLFHVVAAVGPPLFFAIAAVEGGIRPGYHPIAQPISALALGPRGWIQELNFALLAASFLSFAAVLRRQLRDGVASIAFPASDSTAGLRRLHRRLTPRLQHQAQQPVRAARAVERDRTEYSSNRPSWV